MPIRRPRTWRSLATRQAGLIARRQLVGLGYDDRYVDRQVSAERWQLVTPVVICTTTGVLTREQLMWVGVLHAGPNSAIGGLTALEYRGLEHWHRDEITVLLAKSHNLGPVEGIRFVETRRPVGLYSTGSLPVWRTEPAALLFSAYTRERPHGPRPARRRRPAAEDDGRATARRAAPHASAPTLEELPADLGGGGRRGHTRWAS